MKLANVKIVTKDTRCTELAVDGVHLENTVRGYSLTHYAGEAPVLHLDIWGRRPGTGRTGRRL